MHYVWLSAPVPRLHLQSSALQHLLLDARAVFIHSSSADFAMHKEVQFVAWRDSEDVLATTCEVVKSRLHIDDRRTAGEVITYAPEA